MSLAGGVREASRVWKALKEVFAVPVLGEHAITAPEVVTATSFRLSIHLLDRQFK